MSERELPIYNPLVVESTKMAGEPRSETSILPRRLEIVGGPIVSENVLTALETRAKLLAAEQACLELGRTLSEQIRGMNGNELLAYARRTEEENKDAT